VGQIRNFVLRINGPRGSRVYRLPPGETLIGSSPSADVFLPEDARVTGTHARILVTDDEIFLTDLGSRNGTYLSKVEETLETAPASETGNPFKLPSHVPWSLGVGDRFQVGLTELWLDEDTSRAWRRVAPMPAATPMPPVRPDPYAGVIPPGLSNRSLRLLGFLPEIFRTGATSDAFPQDSMSAPAPSDDFMERFLALFESVLLPIDWLVDNFDLYLDPRSAPDEFLPWLEEWFGLDFAGTLEPVQRRELMCSAHRLFQLKGTRTALIEAIRLVTGCTAEVDDLTTRGAHFVVTVRCNKATLADQTLLEQLITAFKPIHTTHQLVIK